MYHVLHLVEKERKRQGNVTEEQKNKRTEEQKNRKTEKQKNRAQWRESFSMSALFFQLNLRLEAFPSVV